MTEEDKSPPAEAEGYEPKFEGEEAVDKRSTPSKNLGSAVVIGAISIYVMFESTAFESPDTIYTAPGLFPFVAGLTLLIMAMFLAYSAIRSGADMHIIRAPLKGLREFFQDWESRRTLMLFGIMAIYVVLVALIELNLRIPIGGFVLQVSSFEVVSFGIVTLILLIFWKAAIWKCCIVSFCVVEALASIFRYGFSIPMPELG